MACPIGNCPGSSRRHTVYLCLSLPDLRCVWAVADAGEGFLLVTSSPGGVILLDAVQQFAADTWGCALLWSWLG